MHERARLVQGVAALAPCLQRAELVCLPPQRRQPMTSYDIVIVGDSPQRRAFKDILQTIPALLSPMILLVREL